MESAAIILILIAIFGVVVYVVISHAMLKHNMDKTTEANNKREQILHDDVQALEMAEKKNKKRDHRMQKDVRALGMAADAELNVLKKKDNMQLNIIKELEERESKSSLVFNQNFKRVDSQIKNTVGAIQNIGSTVGRLEKRQNDVLKKLNLIKQNIATLRSTDMTTDKYINETAIAINELSKEVGDISTRGLNAEIHIKNISAQLAHLEAKFNVNVENNTDVPDLRTRLAAKALADARAAKALADARAAKALADERAAKALADERAAKALADARANVQNGTGRAEISPKKIEQKPTTTTKLFMAQTNPNAGNVSWSVTRGLTITSKGNNGVWLKTDGMPNGMIASPNITATGGDGVPVTVALTIYSR